MTIAARSGYGKLLQNAVYRIAISSPAKYATTSQHTLARGYSNDSKKSHLVDEETAILDAYRQGESRSSPQTDGGVKEDSGRIETDCENSEKLFIAEQSLNTSSRTDNVRGSSASASKPRLKISRYAIYASKDGSASSGGAGDSGGSLDNTWSQFSQASNLKLARNEEYIKDKFLGSPRITKETVIEEALKPVYSSTVKGYKRLSRTKGFGEKQAHAKDTDEHGATGETDPSPEPNYQRSTVGAAEGHSKQQAEAKHSLARTGRLNKQQDLVGILDKAKASLSQLSIHGAEDEMIDATSNIDWDSLPLSPLMHKELIAARNRYRLSIPKPANSQSYSQSQADRMLADPLAGMLASPVRTCRISHSRLPLAFLFQTRAVQHPETKQIWELPRPPVTLLPVDASREESTRRDFLQAVQEASSNEKSLELDRDGDDLESMVRDELENDQAELSISDNPEQPVTAREYQQGATSIAASTSNSKSSVSFMKGSSYMLQTQTTIQGVSSLRHQRYIGLLPHRWNDQLRENRKLEMIWRKDMAEVVSTLMQKEVLDYIKGFAVGRNQDSALRSIFPEFEPSKSSNSHIQGEIGALLYFGKDDSPAAPARLLFSDAVHDMAERHQFRTMNNLAIGSGKRATDSCVMRFYHETKPSIMVYDMTRLLDSTFFKAARDAGLINSAYRVIAKPLTIPLRRSLWKLAHYINTTPKAQTGSIEVLDTE